MDSKCGHGPRVVLIFVSRDSLGICTYYLFHLYRCDSRCLRVFKPDSRDGDSPHEESHLLSPLTLHRRKGKETTARENMSENSISMRECRRDFTSTRSENRFP